MCLKPELDQRFIREERLLTKAHYTRVMARPSYKHHTKVFLILVKTNELAFPRLGMAISKKCNKRAVVRNRIKRLARESFRHHKQWVAGLDCVLIGKPGIDRLSNGQLTQLLDDAWQHLAQSPHS